MILPAKDGPYTSIADESGRTFEKGKHWREVLWTLEIPRSCLVFGGRELHVKSALDNCLHYLELVVCELPGCCKGINDIALRLWAF